MSKELDIALIGVLQEAHLDEMDIGSDFSKLIEQIKAAFANAGYINKAELDDWQADFKKRWNAMTGQEWYDRFVQELGMPFERNEIIGISVQATAMYEAAKRAAGIAEGEQA